MSSAADPRALTALDVVAPALADRLGDPRWREGTVRLIAGGKSNLTFEIEAPPGSLVLRRPPTGALLPRAHDMGREARVQQALAGTAVPVPHIVLVDDGALAGFPFYVMSKVEGHVIRNELPTAYADQPTQRVALTDALVDTLADLHQVDFTAAGLGDFGRPEGFAERQIRLWTRQWEQARTHDVEEMDRLGVLLSQRVPRQQKATLVHGDFRLDNTVLAYDDPSRVAAVLDWELSTLGDPLTDLALLLFYWRGPQDRPMVVIPAVTAAGFPGRDRLIERYAARTGLDMSQLAFYEALARFKFAAITQGIASRVAAGAMADQDFGNLDEEVRATAAEGLDILTNR